MRGKETADWGSEFEERLLDTAIMEIELEAADVAITLEWAPLVFEVFFLESGLGGIVEVSERAAVL